MPRSHPPTLITLVRATVRDHALIARGGTVLVAVSGGADSMALLHVLGLLRRELAFGLFAHGVDHGLRPEAAAELDVAQGFARLLEVPFDRTRVVVGAGGNLQARARAARWEALRAAASRAGATRIATGHHADDRAETMLMRILRGTRARHLGVLPPLDGDRIRPMLPARRADIDAHVRRHRIPHCNDPSNLDPRFLRTRVRLELLPALERLNPRVVEHMYALADELGQLGSPARDERKDSPGEPTEGWAPASEPARRPRPPPGRGQMGGAERQNPAGGLEEKGPTRQTKQRGLRSVDTGRGEDRPDRTGRGDTSEEPDSRRKQAKPTRGPDVHRR